MDRRSDLNEIFEFILSEHCNVSTPKNGAVISATSSSRDPILRGEGNENRISLRETPGGKAVTQALNSKNLTRAEEELAWRSLESKYVVSASGDLKIVAESGMLPKQSFSHVMLPAIVINEGITSANGIPADVIKASYASEPGFDKTLTAQKIVAIINENLRAESLKNLSASQRVKPDPEREAIADAVTRVTLETLLPKLENRQLARDAVFNTNKALEAHQRAYDAKIFKKSPFVTIPYLYKRSGLQREVDRASKLYAKTQNMINKGNESLRSTAVLKEINMHVNEGLAVGGSLELVSDLTPTRRQAILKSVEEVSKRVMTQSLPYNPTKPPSPEGSRIKHRL